MLTSFASMQLEADSRRFGNPQRFIPVGKCSSDSLRRVSYRIVDMASSLPSNAFRSLDERWQTGRSDNIVRKVVLSRGDGVLRWSDQPKTASSRALSYV
jgi:hypothetical protein